VKHTPPPRRLSLGAVAISALLAVTACGAGNETSTGNAAEDTTGASAGLSGTVNGAGSTAQQVAMQTWGAGFQTANPDVTVNYDAIGSGGGREQFEAGGLDFAGSDDYVPDDEVSKANKACAGGTYLEFPVYVSRIAVIYNMPSVKKLNLSPATIGSIFSGQVTKWNDPEIAKDNPGVTLPTSNITPVHRSDESGTTGNFTDYLDQTSGGTWKYGAVEAWPIKSGEGGDGSSGVVAAVKNGEGTIGYADASQAQGLGVADVKVGSAYVAPSPEAAAKVVDESTPVQGRPATDYALAVKRTTTSSNAYPIILISYQIVCKEYDDQATAALVKAFETYVVSADGQAAAAKSAGSAPISETIRKKALAIINQISAK
jgi:phosphate transport system substrate-binding protein